MSGAGKSSEPLISGPTVPLTSIYTPIPISPAEEIYRTGNALSTGVWIREKVRKRQKATPEQSCRRKEAVQSLLVAICLNLVLVALLFLTVVKIPAAGNETSLQVIIQTEDRKSEPSQASGASSPTGGESEPKKSRNSRPPTGIITTTQPIRVVPNDNFLADSSLDLNTMEFETGASNFGSSLNRKDFTALKSERKRAFQAMVSGSGSGGSGGKRGVGVGALKGLFPASKLGNGSGMILFVDMSGSMRQISRVVQTYVKESFRGSRSIDIWGCSLNSTQNSFVTNMSRATAGDSLTDYYFVCDLQDGEKPGGIEALRASLLSGQIPKRLHVISFGEHPGILLARLLKETGGSFDYVSPYLADQPEGE
tara:strand:- start:345 stop:1445 length:1101 start_codon:yes stop_codon:yes gene_type:complete